MTEYPLEDFTSRFFAGPIEDQQMKPFEYQAIERRPLLNLGKIGGDHCPDAKADAELKLANSSLTAEAKVNPILNFKPDISV